MTEPNDTDMSRELSVSVEDESSQETESLRSSKIRNCEQDECEPVASTFEHRNMVSVMAEAKFMLEHSVAKSEIFDWLCLYFGK